MRTTMHFISVFRVYLTRGTETLFCSNCGNQILHHWHEDGSDKPAFPFFSNRGTTVINQNLLSEISFVGLMHMFNVYTFKTVFLDLAFVGFLEISSFDPKFKYKKGLNHCIRNPLLVLLCMHNVESVKNLVSFTAMSFIRTFT